VSVVAPPIDVARAMVARGARREAEIVLRGTLARGGHDGDAHFALATLERGGSLPPGPMPRLDLELVDRWIREGLLVEALALLAGIDLGGPAEEWANLLGELLAPVPAHAEDAFVQMHRELTSGGASLALTILEDCERRGGMPGWAERRLSLLRWMLLDNAEAAPDDHAPQGMAPSALAAVLRVPLSQRSLEGVLEAAEEYGRSRPDDLDVRALLPLVRLLVREMTTLLQMDLSGFQTVPVAGRPAAAMQLRMGNLDGAASIYRSLTARQPGDTMVAQLHDAVRGLQRVLEGRPVLDRSFAPPRDAARAPREAESKPKRPTASFEAFAEAKAKTAAIDFDDSTENESVDDTREPTRSVPNPLMVFEETTVVHPSGEASIPVTSVSIALPDDDEPPEPPPSADALPLVSRRPTSAPPPAMASAPPPAAAPPAASELDGKHAVSRARSTRHAGTWDPAEVAAVAESVRPPAMKVVDEEDDEDVDSETTALPREQVDRALGRARPTLPLGSQPPPPPPSDVPRTEAEMQRADDPDPTVLAPAAVLTPATPLTPPTSSVVVHSIRPIGVGRRGPEDPS
jgi:hypothetical protein